MAKKVAKSYKSKFDWSGLFILLGLGVVFSGIGSLIFWATYTAPSGGPSEVNALSTTQRLVRIMPVETQSKLAFIMAVLFIIFGIFLFLFAIFRVVKSLFVKSSR
jgi:hypothetical protein